MTAADATRIMHSRGAVVIASLLAVAAALVLYASASVPEPPEAQGLVAPWDGAWRLPRLLSLCCALAMTFGITAMLGYLAKTFNLLRSMTRLPAALLLLMQAATPVLLIYLCRGSVLCLAVLLSMLLMMSVYADAETAPRRVFLSFAMVSAVASFDVGALFYVPVLWIASVQLRVFTGRTLSASLMGLATPWIILLGSGVVHPSMLQLPVPLCNPFAGNEAYPLTVLCAAGFTAFLTLSAFLQNIFKVLTYNAQSRAYLGVVTVVSLVTVAASVLDFPAIYSYLPMLNCCAALQLGHLFGAVHRQPRSWVAIMLIELIYIAVSVCQSVLLY